MKSVPMMKHLPAVGRDNGAAVARCGRLAASPYAIGVDGKLWTETTPEAIAETAHNLFGKDAATAIAHCALSARWSRHEADYHFWLAVFEQLEVLSNDRLGEP